MAEPTTNKLSNDEWLVPFKLPNGEYTKQPPKSISKKDLIKTNLIQSFDVHRKNVLDLGCSEGVYSFYLASSGANVRGIDLDERRICRATYLKDKLGFKNVQFERGSILDPLFCKNLTHFDLVIAWGLLHRVPDPFNMLIAIASLCDVISLEWRAPYMFLPPGFSGAVHLPGGFFEWKNLEEEILGDKIYSSKTKGIKLADFWHLNTGAVMAILERFGFKHFNVKTIINESNIFSVSKSWISFLSHFIMGRNNVISWNPSRRVHMLAEKNKNSLTINTNQFQPADWDGRFPISIRSQVL